MQRDFLPADLVAALAGGGETGAPGAGGAGCLPGDPAAAPPSLRGAVAVQARQSPEETAFLLALADAAPALLRGVVGWVDLRAGAASVAAALAATVPGGSAAAGAPAHPRLVAVRHIAEDESDAGWLARDDVAEGVAAVGAAGLAYDLLVRPPQLPAAIALAARLPAVRFVLDHIAKPPIKAAAAPGAGAEVAAAVAAWADGIRALAALPNVWCKLSGLVTEAAWGAWQPSHFEAFLQVACDAFGPERLLIGSDWPVCLLAAPSHAAAMSVAENFVRARYDQRQVDAIFGGNCAAVYRLPPLAAD